MGPAQSRLARTPGGTRMDGASLGRCGLLVVGAGPVGIAALWFAHRYGIGAVALDSASFPLQGIREFAPGLVTASSALDWEIDGLPVDCQMGDQITREELLSYYARVCAYGRLRVTCRQRVIRIEPRIDGVRVHVLTDDGPAHWLAER